MWFPMKIEVFVAFISTAAGDANDHSLKWIMQDQQEDGGTYLPPDDLTHDCKTIRTIDHKNFKKIPVLKHLNKIKSIYKKYNYAYGVPVFGVADFKDESMLRACYLLRYLFAGNEWLRRYAKSTKMYLSGYKGGWCCPPQMGNNGLSCSCGNNIKYPFLGKGAPAHEMAHWFIKRMLRPMAKAGRLRVPKFQDDEFRKYNATKYAPNDELSDFLLNSYYQDKARGSTKIKGEKLHHYFIYTGQENFVINNGGLNQTRANQNKLKKNNKNLYAILKEVWQCENNYIPVCKDAAYNFTKGLSQVMNIGKVDPNDPKKMICSLALDKPELQSANPISFATDDQCKDRSKCVKVIKTGGWGDTGSLKTGVVEQSLGNDQDDMGVEAAWYLRRCCAKTAKFSFV